jgi:2-(1,2-epoxy-1,2-dihydrophenyl)acetyl-CoA isomerase
VTEAVITEQHAGWNKIILNRPEKLNALSPALHAGMAAALDLAEADPACRALLLTGAGRGFCAGQELGDEVMPGPKGEAPDVRAILNRWNPIIRRIRGMNIPVVCAVNGVAAGAGANLALACDLVLAARSARFIQSFVKIGLVADLGGSFFLPRLVGDARARAMVLLGEPVTADQAATWGMIYKAVEDGVLMTEAETLTAHLALQPTEAIGRIKQALLVSGDNDLATQLDLERELQQASAGTADFREGVRAFQEKRPPAFTGGR